MFLFKIFPLLQTNISVNKRNFSGNTALHTAVVHSGARAKELCALLIRYGADPHIQNHDRETDNVCISSQYTRIVYKLISNVGLIHFINSTGGQKKRA